MSIFTCFYPVAGGLALALVQFFYVKYLVLFGLPSMLATMDKVVPPRLPRCVSIMYSFTGMWRSVCATQINTTETEMQYISQCSCSIPQCLSPWEKPASQACLKKTAFHVKCLKWSMGFGNQILPEHSELVSFSVITSNQNNRSPPPVGTESLRFNLKWLVANAILKIQNAVQYAFLNGKVNHAVKKKTS